MPELSGPFKDERDRIEAAQDYRRAHGLEDGLFRVDATASVKVDTFTDAELAPEPRRCALCRCTATREDHGFAVCDYHVDSSCRACEAWADGGRIPTEKEWAGAAEFLRAPCARRCRCSPTCAITAAGSMSGSRRSSPSWSCWARRWTSPVVYHCEAGKTGRASSPRCCCCSLVYLILRSRRTTPILHAAIFAALSCCGTLSNCSESVPVEVTG